MFAHVGFRNRPLTLSPVIRTGTTTDAYLFIYHMIFIHKQLKLLYITLQRRDNSLPCGAHRREHAG